MMKGRAMANLDTLREDAIQGRVKGMAAGGNRILWSAKDIAMIRDHIAAMPDQIIRAAPKPVRKIERGQV
jgi:hypothetical protein